MRLLASTGIRHRLVAGIVGLLALVLVVAGVLVVNVLQGRLVANVDGQLQVRVSDLAHRTGDIHGGFPFRPSPFAEQRAAFLRLDENGDILAAFPSGQADNPEPLPDVSGLARRAKASTVGSVGHGGPRYRVVSVAVPGGTLVAAMSLADVDRTVRSATQVLLLAGLVTLAAAAAVVWFTVRRGLRPIDAMIGTAERIAEGNLTERASVPNPGSEVGHLGTALNTMLDRIEEALDARSRSEARLRRFAADASHELRTPLTSIRGYAELYRQGADDPASVALGMARIESEALRMSELVEDLLLLARLDQGHELRQDTVALDAVVTEAVQAARAVEPDRVITLEVPDDPVEVEGDRSRLRQVVDNLLANVREHTGPTTSVAVRLRTVDGTAELVVADDGPGMTSDEAGRAFERFWQGEATVDHPRRGTGLGLAIVHDLVRTHGGDVTIDTAPGAGATFTVTLPLPDRSDDGASAEPVA